jgi:hypothetical protein
MDTSHDHEHHHGALSPPGPDKEHGRGPHP